MFAIAGLDCISPEVNRNRNIGEVGANMDKSSFQKYLAGMTFNQVPVRVWCSHQVREVIQARFSVQALPSYCPEFTLDSGSGIYSRDRGVGCAFYV